MSRRWRRSTSSWHPSMDVHCVLGNHWRLSFWPPGHSTSTGRRSASQSVEIDLFSCFGDVNGQDSRRWRGRARRRGLVLGIGLLAWFGELLRQRH